MAIITFSEYHWNPAGADWFLNTAINFCICISFDHYHQLKIKLSVRRCIYFLLVTVIVVGGQERRIWYSMLYGSVLYLVSCLIHATFILQTFVVFLVPRPPPQNEIKCECSMLRFQSDDSCDWSDSWHIAKRYYVIDKTMILIGSAICLIGAY